MSGDRVVCQCGSWCGAPWLPDVADEFATRFVTAAIGVFHQTVRGGDNTDAEAVEDARNFGVAVIKAAAGRGDARDAGDGGGAIDVFHFHDQGLVTRGVDAVAVVDRAGWPCRAAGSVRRQPAEGLFGKWRRRPVWDRCRLYLGL